MKSLKIKDVKIDNRKHLITIETAKGFLALPYSKLALRPSAANSIETIYSDTELGRLAVTYQLQDGREDSIPVEAFLEYNFDPDYILGIELHKLSIEANHALTRSGLSKREVCRRLSTSMAQLLRLLDTSNSRKTIDQMIRLLSVLGARVEIKVA